MEAAKEMPLKKQRKYKFKARLEKSFLEYDNILLVSVDNVGSKQLQEVRLAIRGKGELLMGKNTLVRRTINDLEDRKPELQPLLQRIGGNIGFLFLKDGSRLKEIRDLICANQRPAAAKAGTIGQKDVIIPAGVTPLDPGQTSFFQAMNIATKIVKGAIEIVTAVTVIKGGERVSASAVALLGKLDIKPFAYGVICRGVYEKGSVYDSAVLDITPEDLTKKFFNGARHVAALAMALHYPCAASVPHMLMNGFKHLVAISLATDYTFTESKKFKDYLANPGAFAAAAPAAASGANAGKAPAAKAPEPEPEEEEESTFDLFG